MIKTVLIIFYILSFKGIFICQEFENSKNSLSQFNFNSKETLNYIPLLQIDTCFNSILDIIIKDDSLRTYFIPKKTGYVFNIQKHKEGVIITVSPKYIDNVIKNNNLFGAIKYKNRIFMCIGDSIDLFIPRKDLIQINYALDERGAYFGSDSDGILNIVNCYNQKIYFYLRDIMNTSQK